MVPDLSLSQVDDESEKPRSLLSSLKNLHCFLSTFLYSEAIQRTTLWNLALVKSKESWSWQDSFLTLASFPNSLNFACSWAEQRPWFWFLMNVRNWITPHLNFGLNCRMYGTKIKMKVGSSWSWAVPSFPPSNIFSPTLTNLFTDEPTFCSK